jgi:S-DNA-T family DNA segregation ATPase FtsK/SpoIIIE
LQQYTTKNSLINILAILFCASSCIFLAAALIGFDYLDPSINRATNQLAQNFAGKYGAITADLFYQFFGLASYLIVFYLTCWTIILMSQNPIRFVNIRILSWVISMVFLATILANIQESNEWMFTSYGGVVGYKTRNLLIKHLASDYIYLSTIIFSYSFLFSTALNWQIMTKFVNLIKIICSFVWNISFNVVARCLRILIKIYSIMFRKKINLDEIIEIKTRSRKSIKNVKQKTENVRTHILNNFSLPPLDLLAPPVNSTDRNSILSIMKKKTDELKQVLKDFGVKGEILSVHPGPVVTLFEFEPEAGTKSARVIGLSDDIARVMHAESARISTISGRNAMGIELPNSKREIVFLRELLESDEYQKGDHEIPIVLGKNISGQPIIVDLAKMPHLLIAGTTGSGKSVGINTMILSILCKMSPDQCKLIMIDPKVLELSSYDDIPHLLSPVVTEASKAIVALKWILREMENRYRLMSNLNVRNIKGFNQKIKEAIQNGEVLERTIQTGFNIETGKPEFDKTDIELKELPYIVVIVDEMADLMLVAGKDIEASIQRIAQMARAAGIHLIMATQRPSVDVITGVIKANFPTRISFQVTSRIDSRTILGEQGAEQLLGMGDMLYLSGGGKISRVHGPFVSDKEVEKIVDYLKKQKSPEYIDSITSDLEGSDNEGFKNEGSQESGSDNELYRQAVEIVTRDKKASTSYVQRRLRIGYNRAALLIERMEEEGIISAPNHAGKREIL